MVVTEDFTNISNYFKPSNTRDIFYW